MIQVKVKKLTNTAILPTKATDGAAGYDLYADADEHMYCHYGKYLLRENETVVFPTGISMAIPKGYVGLIFPRSGKAIKNGLRLANCVGVIDSDYRGEIKVALHLDSMNGKHPHNELEIFPGDRIGQIIFKKYEEADFQVVDELDETERGAGGFGSTGK